VTKHKESKESLSLVEAPERSGGASTSEAAPPTEVSAKAGRRRFTAEYKRRILREVDACTKPGDIGALLRREGLYSSRLSMWRLARDRGEIAGLNGKKRGPKPKQDPARSQRIVELERENLKLKRHLEQAKAIIEIQKKVSQLLGIQLPETGEVDS
jgi:transposase-like protein